MGHSVGLNPRVRILGMNFNLDGNGSYRAANNRFDDVDRQLNGLTALDKNPNFVVTPYQMNELMDLDFKKGAVRVEQNRNGEYIFHYRDKETSALRLDPQAAELAYSSGLFKWDAPAPALTAARNAPPSMMDAMETRLRTDLAGTGVTVSRVSGTTGTEVAPPSTAPAPAAAKPDIYAEASRISGREIVDEREANSIVLNNLVPTAAPATPVTEPSVTAPTAAATPAAAVVSAPVAAEPAALPAATGPAAQRYNSAAMPQGLSQNQVGAIQEMLMEAGLPIGSRTVDEKWGKTTQASFERVCREEGIDPKAVNFADANDPETQKFLKATQARGAEREKGRADFIAYMDKVIADPQQPLEAPVASVEAPAAPLITSAQPEPGKATLDPAVLASASAIGAGIVTKVQLDTTAPTLTAGEEVAPASVVNLAAKSEERGLTA